MKLSTWLLLLMLPLSAHAGQEFSGITFLKISSAEQAAVVKHPDGQLQLLKTGDLVDHETRIIAFEDNYAVVEGPGEWAPIKYYVDVSAGLMQITRLERKPLPAMSVKSNFTEEEVQPFNMPSR